jgi:hypothetical protein
LLCPGIFEVNINTSEQGPYMAHVVHGHGEILRRCGMEQDAQTSGNTVGISCGQKNNVSVIENGSSHIAKERCETRGG